MLHTDIEHKLKDEKGLEKLLKEYSDLFERIESTGHQLRDGTIDTPHEIVELMVEFGGMYVSLQMATLLTEGQFAYKKDIVADNKRLKLHGEHDTKMLHYYRRVHKILKAYRDSCDKIITICQSKIRVFEKEAYANTKYT